MHPISRIPCADTVHTYIKGNDIDEMMSFFRKMNSEFIDMVNISDSLHVGSDFIRNQSIFEFYNRVKHYNEDKELESRRCLGLV